MFNNARQYEGGPGHVLQVMREVAQQLDVRLPALDVPAMPAPRRPHPDRPRPPLFPAPTTERVTIRTNLQAPAFAAFAARRRRFKKLRRLLRDHITPADLARALVTIILLIAGTAMLAATVVRYVGSTSAIPASTPIWKIPLMLAANALLWILGLTVPSLIVIRVVADLSWLRIVYYFSAIWFLAALALFL